MTDPAPPLPLAELYGVTAHPRPWAFPSLPPHSAEEVLGQLGLFVWHLNTTYAVEEKHLIYPCWPLHRGMVCELATLYAGWVECMQSGIASPNGALYWHDRWLPGFYRRARSYFGSGTETCRTDEHRTDWNPALQTSPAMGKPFAPTDEDLADAVDRLRANPAFIAAPGQ